MGNLYTFIFIYLALSFIIWIYYSSVKNLSPTELFQSNENFEPTRSVKEWWLYTHKTPANFAGLSLPGFFQTTNYERQMTGLFAIFLLEGIATYWRYHEEAAITSIWVSVFVDFILALIAHQFQKPITLLKNELIFEDLGNKKVQVKKKLNQTKLRQKFFYLLILLSALLKFFWLLVIYPVLDFTMIFIFTCYFIAAILHITCTGYAVFTFIFLRKIKSQRNQYLESKGIEFAINPDRPLRSIIETKLEPVTIGHHELKKDNDGKFYFYTRGVLMDKELFEMIGHQLSADQKRAVAIAGVKHQYEILQQN